MDISQKIKRKKIVNYAIVSTYDSFVNKDFQYLLPILVLLVKNTRPAIMTKQATMVTSETALTLYLAKNSGTGKVTSEVKFLGVAPHRSWAAFCKKYETPMAVIRTASGPA